MRGDGWRSWPRGPDPDGLDASAARLEAWSQQLDDIGSTLHGMTQGLGAGWAGPDLRRLAAQTPAVEAHLQACGRTLGLSSLSDQEKQGVTVGGLVGIAGMIGVGMMTAPESIVTGG